ncbi:hypothetical protein GCM10011575_03520 [Microlunatus endophyticus]|uniref:Uncharacterized protein n=1 Tax=Microlunatus endophyticus TaxID=1716077 RepID=A0A917S0F7_9ACTN|nr:hypothetical protein [Microlunatus endophyticus]GGL48821.1 hypothetical protein GCM10011575_03520 [Microlunatus endophyticus]
MSTDDDRPRAGHSNDHHDERPGGAESPRELLAVHDPSRQATGRDWQSAGGRGHGVTVQWVRPTDLAARMAARASAGAVAAHVAAHRQVRASVRARLAPLSAFGRQGESGPVTVERSMVGR